MFYPHGYLLLQHNKMYRTFVSHMSVRNSDSGAGVPNHTDTLEHAAIKKPPCVSHMSATDSDSGAGGQSA